MPAERSTWPLSAALLRLLTGRPARGDDSGDHPARDETKTQACCNWDAADCGGMGGLAATCAQAGGLVAGCPTANPAQSRAAILKRMGPSASACVHWLKACWSSAMPNRRVRPMPMISGERRHLADTRPQLTAEQAVCVAAHRATIDAARFSVPCCRVTGSDRGLPECGGACGCARGENVVFLVPEVALAPQTVGRVRARLRRCAAGALRCLKALTVKPMWWWGRARRSLRRCAIATGDCR